MQSERLLVMLVGAPGTGKSALATRLARSLGAELVQTDRVRKLLFAEPRYNGGEHAAVYGWCHNIIRSVLRVGGGVVFDATNLEERNRKRVYEIAESCGARLSIVWTTCPATVVQERLLRRRDRVDEEDFSDADWPIYLEMRRRADPIRRPHVIVNTAADIQVVLERTLRAMAASAIGSARAGASEREVGSSR